jgi:hypothetical protein
MLSGFASRLRTFISIIGIGSSYQSGRWLN